ncbi:MAG: hypothetical protein ABIP55_12540 [Tepidisphaeraceae bacterium]
MKSWIACIAVSIIALAGVGCTPTKRFDVTVLNKTDVPVMLWLTKDGPPAEKGWLTTEQFLAAPEGTPSPGVELSPHKTADTGKVSGKFPDGTHAVLLVFRTGEPAGQKSPPPLAVSLRPGKNVLAVSIDEKGGLAVFDPATNAPAPLVHQP